MATTELQVAEKGTLRQWVTLPNVVEQVDNALGGWMKGEDFLAQIVISMGRDDLLPCTEKSKFAAAHTCAALALLPSMQHVALIPRKQNNAIEVTVMPQWQGYQAIMLRHPDVLDIRAELVHKDDRLVYNSITKQIEDHAFSPLDPARKFEKLEDVQGGYLEVTYRDGRPRRFHFVTRDDISKAKGCAQTQNIWNKWFKEMCLKTIFRNAYARRVVPIDPLVNQRAEKLNEADDYVLGNSPSRIIDAVDPTSALSRTKHLANQFAPSAPPLESPPSGQPTEAGGKKPAKKKAEEAGDDESEAPPARDPKIHPPTIPQHLAPYASAVHDSKTVEDVEAAFEKFIASNGQLEEADHTAGVQLRDWKVQQLAGKAKGKKELFDNTPDCK